jgi:hypothetical protein
VVGDLLVPPEHGPDGLGAPPLGFVDVDRLARAVRVVAADTHEQPLAVSYENHLDLAGRLRTARLDDIDHLNRPGVDHEDTRYALGRSDA